MKHPLPPGAIRSETGYLHDAKRPPALYWLGQAGFWIDVKDTRILIDPYLSDSLQRKYEKKKYSHERMMPIPVPVEQLPEPDVVLITHAHTDHMDPETLQPLAIRFPDIRFIVPRAVLAIARERIGAAANIIDVDAYESQQITNTCQLKIFPAAHEAFEQNEDKQYPYLGFGISTPELAVYHSGDTVPYPGLATHLKEFAPDIALLPVNGRDVIRTQNGVPGNMTLKEAIDLCLKADIPNLIPHHFGMFAFNSIDTSVIDQAVISNTVPHIIRPEINQVYLPHRTERL